VLEGDAMKQSRGTSLLKSVVSTAVGFAVALVANALVLPLFGFTPSLLDNLMITTIYTVISITRGYALERLFEAFGWRTRMSSFALAVLAERRRQQDGEGFTAEDDDKLRVGELARAGAAYALDVQRYEREGAGIVPPPFWPWERSWWRPTSVRRDLAKAGALILAEGERHDRARRRR
jgi:hypothetical protein